MARILLTGTSSGCGKTTLTCGLLQCWKERGITVQALKCGPDYIDPMFHSKVIGAPSGNLDPYFLDPPTMRWVLEQREAAADVALLEGAMGYYDGIGMTTRCSSWTVAAETQTPAVLVLDCKGMGASLEAILLGFLQMQPNTQIAGVIFNRLSSALYPKAAEIAKKHSVIPLGHLPGQTEWKLESRHLGLITASEISDFQGKLHCLAAAMEQTVDVDAILRLAKSAPAFANRKPYPVQKAEKSVKIAVAQDAAFCFTYAENLHLLEEMGCVLLPFRPIADAVLPECDGLLLSGGYPELYGEALSNNQSMRASIREALQRGMPCIAECGGFLYLHEALEGADGVRYPMVGFLSGTCQKGERLLHFGYLRMKARQSQLLCEAGAVLKAHEFHYWRSPNDGTGFQVEKASGMGEWESGIGTERLYAGFPHLSFIGNPGIAERFVERCVRYGLERAANTN